MYVCVYRSFYSSKRFADVPIPPTEDWEAATGMVRVRSLRDCYLLRLYSYVRSRLMRVCF
jgi:hypothetical protein